MAPEKGLKIGNPNSNRDVTYKIWINGQIHQLDTGEPGDSVDGGYVEGLVNGGWDKFNFRGVIRDMEINGQAQVQIGSPDFENMQSYSRKDAIGYNTRSGEQESGGLIGDLVDAVSGGGSSGGSTPSSGGAQSHTGSNYSGGVSTSTQQRIDQLSRTSTSRDEVAVVDSGSELKRVIESVPEHHDTVYIVLKDGEYNCGAIQQVFNVSTPKHAVSIVGNTEDPLAVQINAPVNFLAQVEKNEHCKIQGVHFANRSQFAGQFLFEHCVFSNLTDGNHSGQLGGKPAGGDYRWCHIGHPKNPGKHAADYYGTGQPFFNKGTTFHATGDFIKANNDVEVRIDGSCKFDGDGGLFSKGYQVDNPNLERGVNAFLGGKRIPLRSE